jgi:endogenous inhibitor of DNA gyrase (YacG/DUF329 family)
MSLCPTCKKNVPEDSPARPFCNPRCKLVDLGNWLSGRYVVSSPAPLDESEGRLPSDDESPREPA